MEEFSALSPMLIFVFAIIILLMLVVKVMALIRSAQKKHWIWFVIMLVFSTAGILPIIYLLTHKR